jgi:transposase
METTGINTDKDQIIQTLESKVKEQAEMLSALRALINHYEERMLLAKRRQFGSSSEQNPNQLRIEELFDVVFNEAEDQAEPSRPEPTYEEITYKRKKRSGKRKDDLSGLPVERVEYELPESERICPGCGETMRDIGVTVRDEIEIVPARVIHKEHAVHAYGCKICGKANGHTPVVRADAPAPLIGSSLATPSAVAHIAVQKYANGVPLYRQEKGLAYDNVSLSRQTMANWIIYCALNYLRSVYSLLISKLLCEPILHADETSVQVLHEPGRAAQSKSYEWLYRTSGHTDHPIAIYEYKETRRQEHPIAFLKGYKGYLHCDGYQVYHNLPPEITIVGCWAHARRYWEKLYCSVDEKSRSGSIAELGFAYASLMFVLEDEYRDMPPEDRQKMRLECSRRVSDAFFDWAGGLKALPKSLLGDAVYYSLSQRKYLENIYLDGRLEISNNRAERSMKPFVQGRKQWLFSDTPNGAEASSIFYSIIETAKENSLHPFHYLKYLLEKLPHMKSSEAETLLPWSPSLPDSCRIPDGAKYVKREKKKPASGPIFLAVKKLRDKVLGCQGAGR